jgi:3-methyladenine DNA glycosylase AlkD
MNAMTSFMSAMVQGRKYTAAAAVRHFDARFRALGTAKRAAQSKAYMKSALSFHGIDAAQLRAEAAAFLKAHRLEHDALIATVDALFATRAFDLRSVGIALLERSVRQLPVTDAPWLAELARAGACWAHVDYLVTKVIGPVLQDHPSLPKRVRTWACDPDCWVRRVALLTQLAPLRRGGGDFALFAEIATPMLGETEFFIRKAIGWVLREISKKRPALVRDFMVEHGARAHGVTFREATKYLPPPMKRQVDAVRTRAATSPAAPAPPERAPRSARSRPAAPGSRGHGRPRRA